MIVKGPFNLTWGGATLAEIETVEIGYETNSEDYEANSGQVYEINKSIKAYVRLTLLATDIPSLSAILPQYFKEENEQLGDNSFVVDERGAIDILQNDCDTEEIFNDLDIVACGDPIENFKLIRSRTMIDGIEISKIRKIVVKFIGEPDSGQSLVQFLGDEGAKDFFQLGNDELFLLGDGNNLIL